MVWRWSLQFFWDCRTIFWKNFIKSPIQYRKKFNFSHLKASLDFFKSRYCCTINKCLTNEAPVMSSVNLNIIEVWTRTFIKKISNKFKLKIVMTGQSNYVSLLIVYDPVSLNLTVAMNFFFAIFCKTTRGELDFRRNRLAASSKQFLPKINKFSIFLCPQWP